jgi:hypothetical protein
MNFFLAGLYFVCVCMIPPDAKACSNLSPHIETKSVTRDSVPNLRVNYQLITNTDHSYGYDIFINGILRVHQPTIPGMPGVRGFMRKEDAKKVASLVVKKVQNGMMPPTIETRELDSLRIKL